MPLNQSRKSSQLGEQSRTRWGNLPFIYVDAILPIYSIIWAKIWKKIVIVFKIWPKIGPICIWMGYFFLKNWYLYGSIFKFRGGTSLPKPNLSTPRDLDMEIDEEVVTRYFHKNIINHKFVQYILQVSSGNLKPMLK